MLINETVERLMMLHKRMNPSCVDGDGEEGRVTAEFGSTGSMIR
jgi:hypothetical protein